MAAWGADLIKRCVCRRVSQSGVVEAAGVHAHLELKARRRLFCILGLRFFRLTSHLIPLLGETRQFSKFVFRSALSSDNLLFFFFF